MWPSKNFSKHEWRILQTLWRASPMSAREIHDQVAHAFSWSYTTTRTIIDRMVNKELLKKNSSHGLYVYKSAVTKTAAYFSLIKNLSEVFLTSEPEKVAPFFAENTDLSPKEIAELKKMIQQAQD